eukprot:14213770-Alexandrium_andersonii.AAC.1
MKKILPTAVFTKVTITAAQRSDGPRPPGPSDGQTPQWNIEARVLDALPPDPVPPPRSAPAAPEPSSGEHWARRQLKLICSVGRPQICPLTPGLLSMIQLQRRHSSPNRREADCGCLFEPQRGPRGVRGLERASSISLSGEAGAAGGGLSVSGLAR